MADALGRVARALLFGAGMRDMAQLGSVRCSLPLLIGLVLVSACAEQAHRIPENSDELEPQNAAASRDAGSSAPPLDAAAGAERSLEAGRDAALEAGAQAGRDGGDAATSEALTFRAYMVGDQVFLTVDAGTRALYGVSCDDLEVSTQRDGSWVAPRNERPTTFDGGSYYLDGIYITPTLIIGCDSRFCRRLTLPLGLGALTEVVKTGTKAPPEGVSDAATPVDVIETRPLSGKVRITLRYSLDSSCSGGTLTGQAELDIPSRGVCCPVGVEGCSASGPGGGWAPSLDACAPYSVEYDGYAGITKDRHGCDVLAIADSRCCNCVRP